jgi:hypothetical protein
MNLGLAEVSGTPGSLVLDLGDGASMTVPQAALDAYPGVADRIGSEVAVGMRPEHFLRAQEAPEGARWDGRKVTLVEMLGAEMLVHFETKVHPILTEDMREAVDDGSTRRSSTSSTPQPVKPCADRNDCSREGTPVKATRRAWRLTASVAMAAMVLAACGGDETADGGDEPGGTIDCGDLEVEDLGGAEVSIFGAFTSVEGDAVNAVIAECFNAQYNADAFYEGSESFEEQIKIRVDGGNPPDIALYPQPGSVVEQARAGKALALEDLGFDIAELRRRSASTSCRSASTRASTTASRPTST